MAWIVSVLIILFLSSNGCAPAGEVDEMKKTQSEILDQLGKMEANQKTILAKLDKVTSGKKRPEVDYDKVFNIISGKSPYRGPKDAPVVITEFSDFQCPYCSRFQPIVKEIIAEYPNEVKHVFKNYPLSFHKDAKNAARAALAAGEQGKFWEMHSLLFENFRNLKEDKLIEYAETVGLDMVKFKQDYAKTYDEILSEDQAEASKAQVRGTPTIFINGKRLKNRSVDGIKERINEIIKKSG